MENTSSMVQVVGKAIRSIYHDEISNKILEPEPELDKKTVGELISLYVDYTDKTPNEPRYDRKGILEDSIFYPCGNIYLNEYNKLKTVELPLLSLSGDKLAKLVEEEWFKMHLQKDQIKFAIKFLQINALKKYIQRNYTCILLENPFMELFYTYYSVNKNLEATKEIIGILIENYDNYYDLISGCAYNNKENEYILELLYTFLPIDEDNLCSICLQTEPKKSLFNPCSCKTPIHTNCILKMNEIKPIDECKVCLSSYKINEPIHFSNSGILIRQEKSRLFFPKFDLYYQPLMSNNELVKVSGMSRLTMAIMYLQVNRVKELLEEPEIIDNLATYYFGYEPYKQSPLIALAQGNMPSNCHITFGNNKSKYIEIFKLLLQTDKIDVEQVDGFNRTVWNYMSEANYGMEFGLLIRRHIENKKMKKAIERLKAENREIKYNIKNHKFLETHSYKKLSHFNDKLLNMSNEPNKIIIYTDKQFEADLEKWVSDT